MILSSSYCVTHSTRIVIKLGFRVFLCKNVFLQLIKKYSHQLYTVSNTTKINKQPLKSISNSQSSCNMIFNYTPYSNREKKNTRYNRVENVSMLEFKFRLKKILVIINVFSSTQAQFLKFIFIVFGFFYCSDSILIKHKLEYNRYIFLIYPYF